MEELVERAKNKDKTAFSELIIKVKKELYLIAKTKLNNEEDIADAIQETLLISYKNLKKLRKNEIFKTWIIRTLINECNKTYKRKSKHIISYEEKSLENYVANNKNDEQIDFDYLIKPLNDEEKIILTLFYRSKYSIKEISEILKINENTLKSKMARARNKIRKMLEENEESLKNM